MANKPINIEAIKASAKKNGTEANLKAKHPEWYGGKQKAPKQKTAPPVQAPVTPPTITVPVFEKRIPLAVPKGLKAKAKKYFEPRTRTQAEQDEADRLLEKQQREEARLKKTEDNNKASFANSKFSRKVHALGDKVHQRMTGQPPVRRVITPTLHREPQAGLSTQPIETIDLSETPYAGDEEPEDKYMNNLVPPKELVATPPRRPGRKPKMHDVFDVVGFDGIPNRDVTRELGFHQGNHKALKRTLMWGDKPRASTGRGKTRSGRESPSSRQEDVYAWSPDQAALEGSVATQGPVPSLDSMVAMSGRTPSLDRMTSFQGGSRAELDAALSTEPVNRKLLNRGLGISKPDYKYLNNSVVGRPDYRMLDRAVGGGTPDYSMLDRSIGIGEARPSDLTRAMGLADSRGKVNPAETQNAVFGGTVSAIGEGPAQRPRRRR